MPPQTSTLELSTHEECYTVERRAWVRRLCNRKAVVRLREVETSALDAEGATVCNLSVRGVGLLVENEFPPDTILVVEPQNEEAVKPLLIARVVYAVPQGDGWYHGCELGHRLSPNELRTWLD
jgi:hypothetical protein